jgi:Transposase
MIRRATDVLYVLAIEPFRQVRRDCSWSRSTFGRSLVKSPSQRRALFPNSRRAPLEAAVAGQGVSRMLVFKPHSGETGHDQSTAEVLIEAPNHKRRRRLSVLNTRAEHDRLIETLRAYGKPVICAFEATGNYHRPIAWRLIEAGFDVRLVSSMALARTREALHNGWDKNDPRDAQVILHMLRIGATQRYHDPLRAGINDVQELSKTHEAMPKQRPRSSTVS